eukprot:CAMPEP_0116917356 /NCGR_PEP_ID=MMETSP0467-20121206/19091_1 /TAXON_ID=283647 /ORGANISM="Mesodinium pulex, Strain SPMC105" /LENGTH=121 /DNA_ID=CAMNT_0004594427 /DNA_START=1418 /DNA_END=1783 /DNA_ORIENTATION=-
MFDVVLLDDLEEHGEVGQELADLVEVGVDVVAGIARVVQVLLAALEAEVQLVVDVRADGLQQVVEFLLVVLSLEVVAFVGVSPLEHGLDVQDSGYVLAQGHVVGVELVGGLEHFVTNLVLV